MKIVHYKHRTLDVRCLQSAVMALKRSQFNKTYGYYRLCAMAIFFEALICALDVIRFMTRAYTKSTIQWCFCVCVCMSMFVCEYRKLWNALFQHLYFTFERVSIKYYKELANSTRWACCLFPFWWQNEKFLKNIFYTLINNQILLFSLLKNSFVNSWGKRITQYSILNELCRAFLTQTTVSIFTAVFLITLAQETLQKGEHTNKKTVWQHFVDICSQFDFD